MKDGAGITTRRRFLEVSGAALAAAAAAVTAEGQEKKPVRSPGHNQANEEQPGPNNTALDAENPSSV